MAIRSKKTSRTVANRGFGSKKKSETHLRKAAKKIGGKRSNGIAAESHKESNAPTTLVAVFEVVKTEISVEPLLDAAELEHFGT